MQHQASYGAAVDWVIRYSYDHENRLVRRRMDANGDGDYEQKRVFAYDGNQVVLDFQHTGAGDVAASDLRQRYLWGPAVDQILAEEEVDGGTADLVAWTLTDHLNTVRDIAKYDPQTGTTTVANHLVYDAFGRVTSESNTAVDSLFLFTARPFDVDAGLQNNLHRWYDPRVGRWLSEDPIGFAAADGNLYRYVGNCPVLYVDPAGLRPIYFKFAAFIGSHLGGDYLPGGRWLPEPMLGGWVGFFFKTDDRGFGQAGTSRLYSEGWIESYDIGHLTSGTQGPTKYYVNTDCDTSFRGNWSPVGDPGFHGGNVNNIWAWRVVSKKAAPSVKTVTVSDGPCESTISITAAAAYPFGGRFAPNIDYTVHFRFRITGNGKVNVSVKGTHDSFPDYEALLDHGPQPLYVYQTAGSGPGIGNLTTPVNFGTSEVVVFAPTGVY